MSRTVYKYQLHYEWKTITGGDPRVVHVGIDPTGDATLPTVWVELDPEVDKDFITLCFIGTGHPVPEGWRHVGSTVTTVGLLVWHVYQRVADE